MPHFHPIGNQNSSKQDKHPRPIAKLEMLEHEFRFFQDEWASYKKSTGIQGNYLLTELWLTILPDLKQLTFDQGRKDSLITETMMMARIKSLAVSILHPAIHRVHLHEAKQSPDESMKTFAARV